jgi:hypothetical protein
MSWSTFNFAEATTVTIPTHAVGDLIMIIAARGDSSTLPTIPSGWFVANGRSFGGSTKSALCAWKLAASASETSGTWTNAGLLACGRFSGTNYCVLAGPNSGANGAANNSVAYSAVSLSSAISAAVATRMASASAFVIGVAYSKQNSSGIDTPPSGMSLLGNGQGASVNQIAVHQTSSAVSSWTATNVTTAGNIDWITLMMELIDTGIAKSSGGSSRPISPFTQQVIG